MSSHREAPEISKDPVADNTDTYAFRDPNNPSMVTLLANYIPLEAPDAGPNFFEFGDDVTYSIYIDNVGDGQPHITYDFRFTTTIRNDNTFLYNTGPINSIYDTTWNRPQTYSVTRTDSAGVHPLGSGFYSPPCNVGIRSTPNYANLANEAIHTLDTGETVFAGQRREGFYVDLGSIFDLLALRPFQQLHRFPTANQPGVDSTKFVNVHTIALNVPITMLTNDGNTPSSVTSNNATIGVWAAASRQATRTFNSPTATQTGTGTTEVGPFVQVSRLGNPLVNEVLIPMSQKDLWNQSMPANDNQFANSFQYPEVQYLLAFLYPTAFPHLQSITGTTPRSPAGGFQSRDDLVAILLTGLPHGIIGGFQNVIGNNPAPVQADMLRLNMAVPPKPVGRGSVYGILGGDLAGFPNGRRVYDDVTTIELRAIAGLTYPLVHPSYTPDGAAKIIYDVLPPRYSDRYHATFPYLGTPHDGYHVPTPAQQAQPAPTPA